MPPACSSRARACTVRPRRHPRDLRASLCAASRGGGAGRRGHRGRVSTCSLPTDRRRHDHGLGARTRRCDRRRGLAHGRAPRSSACASWSRLLRPRRAVPLCSEEVPSPTRSTSRTRRCQACRASSRPCEAWSVMPVNSGCPRSARTWTRDHRRVHVRRNRVKRATRGRGRDDKAPSTSRSSRTRGARDRGAPGQKWRWYGAALIETAAERRTPATGLARPGSGRAAGRGERRHRHNEPAACGRGEPSRAAAAAGPQPGPGNARRAPPRRRTRRGARHAPRHVRTARSRWRSRGGGRREDGHATPAWLRGRGRSAWRSGYGSCSCRDCGRRPRQHAPAIAAAMSRPNARSSLLPLDRRRRDSGHEWLAAHNAAAPSPKGCCSRRCSSGPGAHLPRDAGFSGFCQWPLRGESRVHVGVAVALRGGLVAPAITTRRTSRCRC